MALDFPLQNIANPRFLDDTVASQKKHTPKSTDILESQMALTDPISPNTEKVVNVRALSFSQANSRAIARNLSRKYESSILPTIYDRKRRFTSPSINNNRSQRHESHVSITSLHKREVNTAPSSQTQKTKSRKKNDNNMKHVRTERGHATKSTKTIREQSYMLPKDEFREFIDVEETETMRNVHIRHVRSDLETLRALIFPNTISTQPYDTVTRHTVRSRAAACILRPKTVQYASHRSQKCRMESASSKTNLTKINPNDDAEVVMKNLETSCNAKWNQFVRHYKNSEEEYKLDKMRKAYVDRRLTKLELKNKRRSNEYEPRVAVTFGATLIENEIRGRFLPIYNRDNRSLNASEYDLLKSHNN